MSAHEHEKAAAAASEPESFDARYERMLREREAREKADKQRRRERELQAEDLIQRFERELGPLHSEFELVVTEFDGCIVVKRGEEVLYKRFMSIVNSPKGATDVDHYQYVVSTVVHPEREAFDKLVAKRPHIAQRCANAQLSLHGVATKEEVGKF